MKVSGLVTGISIDASTSSVMRAVMEPRLAFAHSSEKGDWTGISSWSSSDASG
ncbi:MAG: hypothetical protein IKS71_02820 [Bacteroidales bacterium]|nr:hypothetical protein [Bacteroidales bacterium]